MSALRGTDYRGKVINTSPRLTGIGKYTGEMAELLAALGHGVIVVLSFFFGYNRSKKGNIYVGFTHF